MTVPGSAMRPVAFMGALAAGLFATILILTGMYGTALYVFVPLILGAVPVWAGKAKNTGEAAGFGAAAAALPALLPLFAGFEGVICVVMATPVLAGVGALGGVLAWQGLSRTTRQSAIALMFLGAPATLVYDAQTEPTYFPVVTSMEISASPETVWRHVVSFPELPEPTDWFFRAGLAYPQRARIEGSGVGAVRYCEFSTGAFVEPITVWDEPNLLRFQVTDNPPPMKEVTFYENVDPRHLHGYMVSRQGQFRLTRLAGNRTLLEGTTWYRHSLRPEQYWKWWSDAIIHRIHLRVLGHIKDLAESQS